MARINRRALLLDSGSAIIASTIATMALAAEPRCVDREPSRDLRALIKAHKVTYAAFVNVIQEMAISNRDHASASRAEERALLAVCAYPAVCEADRRIKARYLLKIEARGELDMAEQIQALLHSTMWKG
ncbi:MAG: hypothetical protein AAAB35_08215 [Phyllobacterium sp.]|uniref:hypothetical protein n=1 Tax=Phyllobacterium sp. TaxID=1871046 RepID=UPI0030F02D5E